MNFVEYLACLDVDLYKALPSDIRKAAEVETNCFGYNPKETVSNAHVISPHKIDTMVRLAVFQVIYESNEQTWIDERNKQSNEVLKALSYTDSFKKISKNVQNNMNEDEIRFYKRVAEDIGIHMHRTVLQTYSSFVLYVLAYYPEIKTFLQEFRGSEDRYYQFCLI